MQIASDIAEHVSEEQHEHYKGTENFRDGAMIRHSFAKLIFLWKYLNACN